MPDSGKDLLPKILDSLSIGIVILDDSNRVSSVNRAAVEFQSCKVEEIAGIKPDPGIPTALTVSDYLQTLSETETSRPFQIRVRTPHGTSLHLDFTPGEIPGVDRGSCGRVIQIRDVTDHTGLQEVEKEERVFANALVESAALLGSSLNLDEVLDRILELAGQVIQHESINIMLIEGEDLRVVRAGKYKTRQLYDFTMSIKSRIADFPSIVRIIQDGSPLVIPDTSKYPDWQTAPEFSWIQSYIGAPLLNKGKIVGVINLDSGQPGFFSDKDIPHLQAFADLASSAIANSHLYEALQEEAAESSALFKAATDLLAAGGDVTALSKEITQTVHGYIPDAHISILLINEISGQLEQVAQSGYQSNQTHPLDYEGKQGLAFAAIKSRKPVYVADVAADPRFIRDSEITQSEFDIPFVTQNTVIGVLNLESADLDGFSERDRRILLTYAKRAAAALENALLINRMQVHEFQMTLINRLTQTALQTVDFKAMLMEQANQVYNSLCPDGMIILFSHPTLKKICRGYVTARTKEASEAINRMIKRDEVSSHLENMEDTVVSGEEPLREGEPADHSNPLKAWILHRLEADDVHLGSVIMGYFKSRMISEPETQFFHQVVDQIALSAAKNLSILTANDRAREAENLRKASATLTSTLNLQEVLESILKTAAEAIPSARNGLLLLFDEKKTRLSGTGTNWILQS